jgi:hypothetical protein
LGPQSVAALQGVGYWYPLHAFTRREGLRREKAEDAVQAFFERFAIARKGEQREAYDSNIELANQYIEQGSIDRALETLWKSPERYRHWKWGHLLYLCHQDAASIRTHETNVATVLFSPDGRWLVSEDAPPRGRLVGEKCGLAVNG